jgi:hypothetical protein
MADFDEREGLAPSFSEGGEIVDPYTSDAGEGVGVCELKN